MPRQVLSNGHWIERIATRPVVKDKLYVGGESGHARALTRIGARPGRYLGSSGPGTPQVRMGANHRLPFMVMNCI